MAINITTLPNIELPVTATLRADQGTAPYAYTIEWDTNPSPNITFAITDDNSVRFTVGSGVSAGVYTGVLRGTVDDSGKQTKVADLPITITVLAVPDNSWLLMAGIVGSTEYFARTRDAGTYSDHVLMVPSNIDTSNGFSQNAGQFVNVGRRWFLTGTETRVSFSSKGTILSSTDLVNWTHYRHVGLGSRTLGIAFNGERILVSSSFGFMTQSLDFGNSWSSASGEASEVTHGVFSTASNNFIFGAYGDDVLVGQTHDNMSLVDTPLIISTTSDDIPSIAIDNTGTRLVIGNRRGQFGYSTDSGVTWNLSASAASSQNTHWLDIKYLSELEFFACGSYLTTSPTVPNVARTLDGGVTWQIVDIEPFTPAGYVQLRTRCCAYSDGRYYFAGDVGLEGSTSTRQGILMWTTDFVSFETELVPDVKFIAALTSGQAPTEPAPLTWASQVNPFGSEAIYDAVFADGTFIAVGTDNLTTSVIAKSPDGETWTPVVDSSFDTSSIRCIEHDARSMFVAAGASGKLATSTDGGNTWTQRTSGFETDQINRVRYLNGAFFAMGEGGQMRRSTNGTFWSSVTSPFAPTTVVQDMALGTVGSIASTYVVVSDAEGMFYSNNYTNWNPVFFAVPPDGGLGPIYTIAFGGTPGTSGRFYAGGANGRLVTSTDGIEWAVVDPFFTGFGSVTIRKIVYQGGVWIVAGDGGFLAYSIEAKPWEHAWTIVGDSGMSTSNILGIARDIESFVAVGSSGRVAKSSVFP